MVELVSSLGFPIAMCLLMYTQMIKQNNQHQQEIEKITEAIANNTVALTRLSEKIEAQEGEKKNE